MDSQGESRLERGGPASHVPGRRPRPAGRALTWSIIAVALLLAAVPTVASLASGHRGERGHPPHGFKRSDYPVIPMALMRHAPIGRARSSGSARKHSRTAYRGRSRRRALRLLRASFPQLAQLARAGTPKLPSGARVDGYLGDYAMRIALPHSTRRQIVLSPLPVRKRDHSGRKRKLSLRLHKADTGFEPINPLVDSNFPTTLGDGISIGDQGVRVRPASPTADAASGAASDGQVFYADTATDQDMLVSAVPTGVELFTQIRAVDSPELQALQFDLPAGAQLQSTNDGGVEVMRGSDRLALVLPPSATDADGTPVPARYAISGSRLTIEVSHREGSYAYPILVDPVIEDWGAQSSWQNSWFYNPNLDQLGWFFADSPAGQLIPSTQGTSVKSYGIAPGRGLYVFAQPNSPLPGGSYGEWLWRAPGTTTFIPRADFGLMYRDTQADTKNQSVLLDGIYSDSQHAFEGIHQFPGRTLGQSDVVRPGDNVAKANRKAGNLALFSLAFPKDHNLKTWTTAYLGGAAIYLDDPEAPTITGVRHSTPPPAWVDPATGQATVSASDPGLGVQAFTLSSQTSDGRNASKTVASGCGTRAFECPNQTQATFRYADLGVPDGTSTLSVTATDPVAHVSQPTSWQVRADSSSPTMSVSGRLHDAAGHFLDADDYALQVSASDGDVAHPSSGVKSVDIQVDGQRKDYVEQTCDQSCQLVRSFTLHPADYAEGTHTVAAIATDQVGHQTTQSWQVKIDRAPPLLTLSGSLADAANTWLGGDSYDLTAAASDTGGGVRSIEVQVDGQRADYAEQPCDQDGCSLTRAFQYVTDHYGDGQHTVKVIATDQAGNQSQQTVTAKVDRTQPTYSLSGSLKDAEGQQLTADSYGLSVNAFDGDASHPGSGVKSIELQVDGQRADYVDQPCDAGSCPLFHDFTLDPVEYRFGDHTVKVIVTDQAGRAVESSWNVSVPDNPADAPPRAPHLSGTATTSTYDATRFLYAGANPVQTGADPSSISPVRAAVLRGQVKTRDGQPLGGVHISVVDHPEYGSTDTRADGQFYMAVNGGGKLRVRYERDGYLPSERWVDVPWQGYGFADDVALVPLDSNVTQIQLGAQLPPDSTFGQSQVAHGGVVSDSDGTRQATLLFKPGTTAQMVLPNGQTQPLSTLHVRATEYTVGASGQDAMPGPLPPTSAYTYAVDYSVDEALAVGAQTVQFSQPVVSYTDNFLNMPVGVAVPVGYYDRTKGAWVPMPDGRVVKILSEDGGKAQLDIAGKGQAASASDLATLGIDDEELQRLAQLYSVGKTLWRVAVQHFTPIDDNYPPRAPADAIAPDGHSDVNPPDGNCHQAGSDIGCQSQTLGESAPLTDVGSSLHYQSARVPGNASARTVSMRVIGANVPASLQKIYVTAHVAGRTFTAKLDPAPNAHWQFAWDGKDGFGRTVQGSQPLQVRIGYTYSTDYATATPFVTPDGVVLSFAGAAEEENRFALVGAHTDGTGTTGGGSGGGGGGGVTATDMVGSGLLPSVRVPVTIYRQFDETIGAFDTRQDGLGGWSIDGHNSYDPLAKRLYLGDGTQQTASQLPPVITTIANGNSYPDLGATNGLAVGPDGSIYVADFYHYRVLRRWPDGHVTLFAGKPPGVEWAFAHGGFSGDGGPATQAELNKPGDVAVEPDGSVLILDALNQRIRRVSLDGTITTVAGNGTAGESGDGGPATQAQLASPSGIAVGPDGSLYISERGLAGNGQVRRVDAAGTITTVLGPNCGDPSCSIYVGQAMDVAVTSEGSIYVAGSDDLGASRLIRKRPAQNAEQLSREGTTRNTQADGVLVGQAQMKLSAVEPAPGGNGVYLVDSQNRKIRLLTPDDRVNTVVGDGSCRNYPDRGDNGPATAACLLHPSDAAVGPDGALYTTDFSDASVRRVAPPMPGFTNSDIAVPSRDGSELYQFDKNGRHLRTVDTLTGATTESFAYDGAGRLAAVTDGDGNVARIERDRSGSPTAIVGPDGVRDTLATNPDGYLTRVTDPAGDAFAFDYSTGGLLTSFTDPNGNTSHPGYDAQGRLTSDQNANGDTQTLSRSDSADGNSYTVTHKTPMGRQTAYGVSQANDGSSQTSSTIDSAGQRTDSTQSQDGSARMTMPDGLVVTGQSGGDPRFGMLAPVVRSGSVATPGGLHLDLQASRSATLADPSNPLSLTSSSQTTTIAGQAWTSSFDASAKRFTGTTPSGRSASTDVDSQGRPLVTRTPGIAPTTSGYDVRGRLIQNQQGSRVRRYSYDAAGNVASITDPLAGLTQFAYDAAGRMTSEQLPDGRQIAYHYDRNGNLTAITPPGRPEHNFASTALDQPFSYTAPDAGDGSGLPVERYGYNPDRQLTSVSRPDGSTVQLVYDAAGRLSKVSSPTGDTTYGYDTTSGHLSAADAPSGEHTTLSYDGSLPLSQKLTGPVAGEVRVTFDNAFRVGTSSVDGTNPIGYFYDRDGLVTGAGSLSLSRDPANGFLRGTTLGTTSEVLTYNEFGEPQSLGATVAGNSIFGQTYVRDDLGRVIQTTETGADGQTHSISYTYDAADRLSDVRRDGALVAHYDYDANGNRVARTSGDGAFVTASYDTQDRLTRYGGTSYTYTQTGDLRTKTDSGTGGTTTYGYDGLGNLTSVALPSGRRVDYLVDAAGNRVGRKLDGQLVQGLLYGDSGAPLAELDGQGNVVSRFVYATKAQVPDYMIRAGHTYRIVSDDIGSPRLVVDSDSGQVVEQIAYDEFGNVTSDSNPGFQPFGFAGGIYDRDTGLLHFGAREYDPQTGRFTQKDAIGFAGGDTNLYGYVANDPVNGIDPGGNQMDAPQDPLFDPGAINRFLGGLPDPAQELLNSTEHAAQRAEEFWADKSNHESSPVVRFLEEGAGTLAATMNCDNAPVTIAVLSTAYGGAALVRGVVDSGWFWRGGELVNTDGSVRIAPFGNPRTQAMLKRGIRNPWYRRLPHYHRRRLGPDGEPLPGQGIGRHRPWEPRSTDRRFRGRF